MQRKYGNRLWKVRKLSTDKEATMPIRTRLIRYLITLLYRRYRFLVLDIVVGPYAHIHLNPYTKTPKTGLR